MARAYIIRSGCSFRCDNGSLATGGDTIELEDDVASAHAEKLAPVADQAEVQADAPADPVAEA
jgi:hypothetical protein